MKVMVGYTVPLGERCTAPLYTHRILRTTPHPTGPTTPHTTKAHHTTRFAKAIT